MTNRTVISPDRVLEALQDGYTLRMEGTAIIGWKELPGLTPAMLAALQYIHAAIEHNGVSPSYTEIGAALGIVSRSRIHGLVKQLKGRGYIVDQPYCARSIRLTRDALEAVT